MKLLAYTYSFKTAADTTSNNNLVSYSFSSSPSSPSLLVSSGKGVVVGVIWRCREIVELTLEPVAVPTDPDPEGVDNSRDRRDPRELSADLGDLGAD